MPCALVDANGFPYKASKSTTTAYIKTCYKMLHVVIPSLPQGWIPDVVILEGTFIIQTPPLPTMTYMQDYVQLLLTKFVWPHFAAGVMEAHVIFDNPGALPKTPKEVEQSRWDLSKEHQVHADPWLQTIQQYYLHSWQVACCTQLPNMQKGSYSIRSRRDDVSYQQYRQESAGICYKHWGNSIQHHNLRHENGKTTSLEECKWGIFMRVASLLRLLRVTKTYIFLRYWYLSYWPYSHVAGQPRNRCQYSVE